MQKRTVEQALRYIEDRATKMRFLIERAAESPVMSEPGFFSGLWDTIRRARRSQH